MTSAPSFSTIYAFGDSLSDGGNLSTLTTGLGATEPVSPPYYQATYDVGGVAKTVGNVFSNGPTWVQDLSVTLGLGTLAPSLLGGTDFAVGGAETGPTTLNQGNSQLAAISLPSQIADFRTTVASPSANALYTLWIGSNDLLDILGATSLTAAQQASDVTTAVNNELNDVASLVAAGAKNLLVVDVPDLGKTPEVMDGLANNTSTPSASFDALASQLAANYDAQLNAGLEAVAKPDGLDLHILNAFQIIDNAVATPSAYGLSNVTQPVWSGSFTSASSGTLAATGSAQNGYLFFDHLHPTETGHQVIAAAALTALEGPPACFAAGTRITTARGPVPVEALCVGDMVQTTEGPAPVIWLGHRHLHCDGSVRDADVWPVHVAAHAFGMGRPARDVLLSPDHAVFCDGVLIPVRYLVNDATVRQVRMPQVTYWHVELPQHAVLLADGLPAESYLDTGNRDAFANGADLPRRATRRCAALVMQGRVRDAVYRRLIVQALALGWQMEPCGGDAVEWRAPQAA